VCENGEDCPSRFQFCIKGFCSTKTCLFDKSCRRHNPDSGFVCKNTPSNRKLCLKSKMA
jgi:hypothetical protein